MAKILASKVHIQRRYPVYCDECEEAVTNERGNSYGFETRAEAVTVKKEHLEQHESGYFE